jgi:hypothetical protein
MPRAACLIEGGRPQFCPYYPSGEAGAILQREDVIGAAGPPC